tara:strand:+ start:627 stop:1028 length:402 start_codon:yes stop_codon:yes gene_type:complete
MSFKLGRARQPYAVNGEIKNKLSFKDESTSTPGTPIVRKTLEGNILGEANMDGSIYLSNKVKPGSEQETQVLLHEMRHATDMKTGKLAYNDDSIKYNGITYQRETIDGKDMIKVDGKWTEAGGDFPWEKDANI